jgi:hypothetical protein
MTGPVFKNNAVGVLAASYTDTATSITLSGGQGDKFPSPTPGNWFPITVVDAANNIEIMRCDVRSGDTLTVVRGQEGTNARALAAGEKVEHRLTAGAIEAVRDAPLVASQIPNGFITGAMIAPLAITSGKIALGNVGGNQLFQGRFIHEGFLDVGVAELNLGFKPVQQGGGVGQDANKINLGWAVATTKFKLSVDGLDKGNLLVEVHDGTVNTAGYRGLVTNVQNNDYTFGFVDNGRQVLHTSTSSHSYFIPTDAAVHILIGGIIKIVNHGNAGGSGSGAVAIVPPPGVVLVWLPSGSVGARTLGSPGTCMLEKMDATTWWIYGMGVS